MKLWAIFLSQMCSMYMLGVIWIIQLIQYPQFDKIESRHFSSLHGRHTSLMSFLVGPVMILELLAALWLVFHEVNYFSLMNIGCVVVLWMLTFFVSVPLHNRLIEGMDVATIHKLNTTNWPRTILWSGKAVVTSVWLYQTFALGLPGGSL